MVLRFTRVVAAGLMVATMAGLASWGSAGASQSPAPAARIEPGALADATTLHDAMRKLWEDHITWTRLAIIDIADNAPGQQATVDRLLDNQVDIGNAIKPYYGERAGSELTALLNDHITIAADLIKAAKAEDTVMVDSLNRRWQQNADDISMFLAQANPVNWKYDAVRTEMREHLDLTLQEASLYIKGDYPGSVAMYDRVHEQILAMADMLTTGIERQFPEQFSGNSPVNLAPVVGGPGSSVPQVNSGMPGMGESGSAY